MLALLTSRLAGPIASAAAILFALALAANLISAHATEAGLKAQISSLNQSIDAPTTGWRAKLAQSEENAGNLQRSLDTQTAQVAAWKGAAAAAAIRADADARAAQVARAAAQKSAADILSLKPGADHCASALDLIRSP